MINYLFRQSTLFLAYTFFCCLTAIHWADNLNKRPEAMLLLWVALTSAVCYWFSLKIERRNNERQ